MLVSWASSASSSTSGPEHIQLAVPSGEQLDYLNYPAEGKWRLIWVSSERGQGEAERAAATELARRGVEVWMVDLAFSYLLEEGRKGLDQVPPADIRVLLRQGSRQKELVVFALGRAAVPLLRALGSWRENEGRPQHLDYLLMHPNLYEEAEALQEVRYLELGNLEGARLLIMQPRRSAGVLWLDCQAEALRKQGAIVKNEVLERLREGFWARQEATEYEVKMSQRLADLIWDRLPKGNH
jgi:hypothetical protein